MKLKNFLFVLSIMGASASQAAVSVVCGANGSNYANCTTQDAPASNDSSFSFTATEAPAATNGSNASPSSHTLAPASNTNAPANSGNGNNYDNNTNSNQTFNNGNGSMNGGGYDMCASQAQNLISECAKKSESAMSNCDTNGNSSLTSTMSMASQMTTAMSSSTPSASGSCSNMGMLGASAQAALAAYQATCSNAKSGCLDACDSARKSMAQCASQSGVSLYQIQSTPSFYEVSSNYNRCSAQQAKVDQAGTAIANIMSETQKAKECQAQLAAMNTPSSDPNSAYCKAHPTVASCILNCNHPSMLGNQTCICVKNPYDPSCGGAASTGGIAAPFNAIGGGSSKSKKASSADILGNDSFDADRLNATGEAGRKAMAGQVGEETGGRQGGSANLGAGMADSGSSGKPSSGGGIDAPPSTSVNGGFYASGGGSGGYAGGSGSGGGGTQYSGGASNAAARGPNAPDLRQFLPGGKLDPSRRGIAGINGIDGISGPNETNWIKMQRRYRILEATLLP